MVEEGHTLFMVEEPFSRTKKIQKSPHLGKGRRIWANLDKLFISALEGKEHTRDPTTDPLTHAEDQYSHTHKQTHTHTHTHAQGHTHTHTHTKTQIVD